MSATSYVEGAGGYAESRQAIAVQITSTRAHFFNRRLDSNERLSVRDALHVASMERHGVLRIMSSDTGFDGLPDIERLS
jgi:predicted nucleic acid-binding protein